MTHPNSDELKVSVPDAGRRSAVTSLSVDPIGAQVRQVPFFDMPDSFLAHHRVDLLAEQQIKTKAALHLYVSEHRLLRRRGILPSTESTSPGSNRPRPRLRWNTSRATSEPQQARVVTMHSSHLPISAHRTWRAEGRPQIIEESRDVLPCDDNHMMQELTATIIVETISWLEAETE